MSIRGPDRHEVAVTGSALGAVGVSLVAAVASLCCVGPVVVAVIGTTGAVAAASLTPYRAYFLAVAFALLGWGFWRAYRPQPVGDRRACATGSGRVARSILWISLAVTLAVTALPLFLPWLEVN